MANISGETILITGATSGIGKALALKLCQENVIIACGRNTSALDELAKHSSNIHTLIYDVAGRDANAQVKHQLNGLVTHIDRVIMNAGDCQYTSPNSVDIKPYRDMMDVNFFGWINTLELTLEHLKKSGSGHLIGISSQVVFAPFPLASAYGASKAAASYFLKSIALELRQFNIQTTVIHPGFVDTPLTRKNNFPMPFVMNAKTAADKIISAIEGRVHSYSFPKRLKLVLLLSKLFPKLWVKKLSKK